MVVVGLVAVVAVLGAAAPATANPPAPPPQPPTVNAPADTYRGRTEAWVRTRAFPALVDRAATDADARFWADRAVRSSPAAVAVHIGTSLDGRGVQVGMAYRQVLDRDPSDADRRFWADRLIGGWSHDRLVAFLLSSPEQARRFPADPDWVSFAFDRVLGRTATSADRTWWAGQVASSDRNWVARRILAAGEARGLAADGIYLAVRGRAPTAGERTVASARLRDTAGDLMRVRAEVVAPLAPAGYRVGVVGDSVGFDLVFRAQGESLPATVMGTGAQRPVGSGRLGCAVLSDRSGYRWPRDPQLATSPSGADWGEPADGRCDIETPLLEDALLDTRPQVIVWQVGSWEWTRVMRPNGTVIGAITAEMREEVATAMVRRMDGWVARGVRKVVLPRVGLRRRPLGAGLPGPGLHPVRALDPGRGRGPPARGGDHRGDAAAGLHRRRSDRGAHRGPPHRPRRPVPLGPWSAGRGVGLEDVVRPRHRRPRRSRLTTAERRDGRHAWLCA